MKYVDEYRDPQVALGIAQRIKSIVTRPWVLMEVCGGQTHTLMRYGMEELLPREVELVHGPGCPVCVTPLEIVDRAIRIASLPDVIFTSYGDMLRVPGSASDLLQVKAAGGDVRIVYSPMDAVKLAQANPDRRVCFFGVGFETTAPANAMAVWQAKRLGLSNFSMLVSHVLVPPAMRLILGSPSNRVQGFIGPGHVCTVMGSQEYDELAAEFKVPIVIGGFEPVDLLEAIHLLVAQLEEGRAEVENQYVRSVSSQGNPAAQRIMREVFQVTDRKWRGIGSIEQSGFRLRDAYARFDAERLFEVGEHSAEEPKECISALVLQGLKKPMDCTAFGTRCTPMTPLGAPMVSTEGACAAYYQYRRHTDYPVRQITTAGACHLDAHMVENHVTDWLEQGLSLLLVENVGNLVCPTSYDLGEDAKIVVLSVAEGEDKPLKYPGIFRKAELMILNKIDLLPYVPFQLDRARENARSINPTIDILETSCTTGAGFDQWLKWLAARVERKRAFSKQAAAVS